MDKLCQNCIKYLESEVPPWSKIQGILYDLEINEETRPTYERALRLHFVNMLPDYEETLALNHKELSEIKDITGSVFKEKSLDLPEPAFLRTCTGVPRRSKLILTEEDKSDGEEKSDDEAEPDPNADRKTEMFGNFEGLLSPTDHK